MLGLDHQGLAAGTWIARMRLQSEKNGLRGEAKVDEQTFLDIVPWEHFSNISVNRCNGVSIYN